MHSTPSTNYNDVQIPGSVAAVVNGVQTFIGITTNAAKATIKGVELESTAVLSRGFAGPGSNITLSGTVGYIDPQYKHYIGPTGADIAQYRYFQNTPNWTASGTLGTLLPVGGGDVTASATFSYRSLTHQFETANPFLDQPGYALLDANLVYSFGADGRFSIGLHAKNLTDKRYKTSGYLYLSADPITGRVNYTPSGGVIPTLGKEGVATSFYGNPRQVFATFTARF